MSLMRALLAPVCAILLSAGCSTTEKPNKPFGNIDSVAERLASKTTAPKFMYVPGFDVGLFAIGSTSAASDSQLKEAIDASLALAAKREDAASLAPLEEYVSTHPDSGWNATLLANLGLAYYRMGYFTRALDAWERSWNVGASATEPLARAVVDRVMGERARMHARVGAADAVDGILRDVEGRHLLGVATELIQGAREGVFQMRTDPGIAYLCGPKALKNMLLAQGVPSSKVKYLDEERSGPRGYSLSQVSDLAGRVTPHRLIRRAPGEPIPVPSVVHWKLNHFAAIVEQREDFYRVQDPTFGQDLMVSRDAIEDQSSGYFLVPAQGAKKAPISWQEVVGNGEADQVRGTGYITSHESGHTSSNDRTRRGNRPRGPEDGPDPLRPESHPTKPRCVGMCEPDVHLMAMSLNLTDTPVGYSPQYGAPVYVRVSYNQREDMDVGLVGTTNLGPKWSPGVISYIEDQPTAPGTGVKRKISGGGMVAYQGYSTTSTSGTFAMEKQTGAVLTRTPASGPASNYTLAQRDGTQFVYETSDGATSGVRRVFLTRVVDPQGASVSFAYTQISGATRLDTIADANGRLTRLYYEHPSNALLLTKAVDPFGRSAVFGYDAQLRLTSIQDAMNMVSTVAYQGLTSDVFSLATPYGTTTFDYGGDTSHRYVNITDPTGSTEKFESKYNEPTAVEANVRLPAGFGTNAPGFLAYRNSFYWNAKAVADGRSNDYRAATIYHWLHTSSNVMSGILESTKYPLENRIWYAYPGQGTGTNSTVYEGTHAGTVVVARFNDQGVEERSTTDFDQYGNVALATDAIGRKTKYEYYPGGVDLKQKSQRITSTDLYQFTEFYGATFVAHQWTYLKTADNSVWGRVLYSNGQVFSVTDPMSFVTQYSYDSYRRLSTITNPTARTGWTFIYPAELVSGGCGGLNCELPATIRDSEGRELKFQYDALDRLTMVTFPDGTTEKHVFTKLDETSYVDRLGRTTTRTYYDDRRLNTVRDALLNTSTMTYFPGGYLKTLADARGVTRTYDVDIQGRAISKTYNATGNKTLIGYDGTGRVSSIADQAPNGTYPVYKNYTYAADGRLLWEANAQGRSQGFTWDPFWPRKSSIVDIISTRTLSYHPAGGAGGLRISNDASATYGYDALGRITSRSLLGDSLNAETWTYDAMGRISTHNTKLGNFTYNYFGDTDAVSTVLLNGYSLTSYTYDTNFYDRRLKAINHYTSPASSFTFTYTDPSLAKEDPYNIHGVAETRGGVATVTWKYVLDATYKLRAAQVTPGSILSYVHDAAGNFTRLEATTNLTFNLEDQISAAGYVYDGAGQRTSDPSLSSIAWDGFGQMAQIGEQSKPAYSYLYNMDGQPQQSLGATNTYRFLWCQGDQLCGKTRWNGSTFVLSDRYYAEGQYSEDRALGMVALRDHTLNVRSITDTTAAHTVYAGFDYTPFGKRTLAYSGSQPSLKPDFTYGGMYQEQDVDNIYVSASRFYDARTGQFLSRDPIGELGGTNLYSYADGNPITNADPSGHMPIVLPVICAMGGCEALAAAGAGAMVASAALVGAGISWCINRSKPKDDDDATPKRDCAQERKDAARLCAEQFMKPPRQRDRQITGGKKTIEACMLGLISRACGGNRID